MLARALLTFVLLILSLSMAQIPMDSGMASLMVGVQLFTALSLWIPSDDTLGPHAKVHEGSEDSSQLSLVP